MQPVSTYGAILTQINSMTSSSQLSDKLSQELSNNSQGVDLADNPNRAQVIDLTGTKDQLNSYIQSCTLGTVTTSLYTNSLSNILSIAQTALNAVQSLQGEYTGQASPLPANQTTQEQTDAYNAFQSLGETIDQSLTETTIGLNEQSPSGAYLYAGLRNPTTNPPLTAGGTPAYNLPPVTDLTQLPYLAATNNTPPPNPPGTTIAGYTPPQASLNTIVTSPTLPVYDTDYTTAAPASASYATAGTLAWGTQNVTINQNQTQALNITSNNPAFQNLINGLQAARTACDQAGTYSTSDRDNFMSLAYSSLSKAVSGIEGLQQTNDMSQLAFQSASQTHNNNLTLVTTQLDDDVAVDTTTVTAQLASVQSQLQASYKVTSELLSMSLINYLQ
jgi:hypothetical protein